jgi:osmoprotectant transport system permease protein
VNSVVTTAVLAILVDAALVGVRRVLTPWMPRIARHGGPRPTEDRPGETVPELEDAAR